jgi:RNA polymerase sigma-70 factor (ECF subfamily)
MELLERFARGELEAFETLFRRFQGHVHGWILRVVRDPAIAEDLTVETFWRVYRSRACFDPGRGGDPMATFGAWARRIGTNLAIDHLRKSRPEVEWAPEKELASLRPPADPVVDRERQQAIARAFASLPASLRATATLALIEEQPYAEIAEVLGTSIGVVKNRVFRAVRLLRKRLRKLGVEP